jgi:hypothetical protein
MVLHPRFKLKQGQDLMVEQEGHLLRLESINANIQPTWLDGTKRSQISSFSRASRYRLIQEVSTYGKLTPIFGTLGYNNPFPTWEEAKYHLDQFGKKVLRKYPNYWVIWKMEFYESGCIHFHVLIYSPDGRPFIPKEEFKQWWCSATGRRDLYPRIERLRSHRGGIYYATKYLCKEQDELKETDAVKNFSGRYWGIIGRKNRVTHKTKYRLSPDEYKYLHGELCIQLATKRIKYELRKEGNEWDHINAVIDTGIYEEKIHALAKSMITKNKAPTKLLTDDKHWLDKIQHLVKTDTDSEFENMYNQL